MRHAFALSQSQAEVDARVGWHLSVTVLLVNLSAVIALWAGFGLFQQDLISGPVLVLLPIALLGLGEVYGMLPEAFGKFGATLQPPGVSMKMYNPQMNSLASRRGRPDRAQNKAL